MQESRAANEETGSKPLHLAMGFLISGDLRLLKLEKVENIIIANPTQFLKTLEIGDKLNLSGVWPKYPKIPYIPPISNPQSFTYAGPLYDSR